MSKKFLIFFIYEILATENYLKLKNEKGEQTTEVIIQIEKENSSNDEQDQFQKESLLNPLIQNQMNENKESVVTDKGKSEMAEEITVSEDDKQVYNKTTEKGLERQQSNYNLYGRFVLLFYVLTAVAIVLGIDYLLWLFLPPISIDVFIIVFCLFNGFVINMCFNSKN